MHMFSLGKIVARAIVVSLAVPLFSHAALANGFTGKEFLTWNETAQDAFLQNSVLMASTISSRLNAEHAACVSNWYFSDASKRNGRNAEFKEMIKEHSDFHPSAVVLAVIERECGRYGD